MSKASAGFANCMRTALTLSLCVLQNLSLLDKGYAGAEHRWFYTMSSEGRPKERGRAGSTFPERYDFVTIAIDRTI